MTKSVAIAIVAILFGGSILYAQGRSLGARTLVLDDNAGNTLTLVLPTPTTWTGNLNIPIPAGGFMGGGTAAGGDLTGSYPNPNIINTAGNDIISALNHSTPTTPINVAAGGTGVTTVATANQFFANTTLNSAPGFRSIASGDLPVATTSALGVVQPDGTTITISGGIISSVGGGSTGTAGGDLTGSYPDPTIKNTAGNDIVGALNNAAPTSPIDVAAGGTGAATVATANQFFANTTAASAPAFRSIASADLPVGTSSAPGALQADGSTISVSPSGVISVIGTPPTSSTQIVDFARTSVSATPYNATAADNIVAVNSSSTAITVNLPLSTSLTAGHVIMVKDEGVNASVHNITINTQGGDQIGTSAGSVTSQAITVNGGIERYYTDGVGNWFLW